MKVLKFVKVKPSLLTGIFQFPLPPPPTYPNLNKVVQCGQKFLIINLVVNITERRHKFLYYMEGSGYSMLVGGYKQSGGEGINLSLLQTLQHSQKVLIKVNV